MEYKVYGLNATYEEYVVFLYLDELKDKGYIKEMIFQPESFNLFEGLPKKFYKLKELKTKFKKQYSKKQYLINPHVYTTDFKIYWYPRAIANDVTDCVDDDELRNTIPFIYNFSAEQGAVSYLEVKPGFDQNNMTRMFTNHIQPLVWDRYNVYVQLIKPMDLFKSTFIPEKIIDNFFYKKDAFTGKGVNRRLKARKGDKKYSWEYNMLKDYLV